MSRAKPKLAADCHLVCTPQCRQLCPVWRAQQTCRARKPPLSILYRTSLASRTGTMANSAICFCSSCFFSCSIRNMRRPASTSARTFRI